MDTRCISERVICFCKYVLSLDIFLTDCGVIGTNGNENEKIEMQRKQQNGKTVRFQTEPKEAKNHLERSKEHNNIMDRNEGDTKAQNKNLSVTQNR